MDEIYAEAASILSKLDKKETSFRNLIFASYHYNKKMLYKICFETLNRREILEKILLKVPKLAKDENFAENRHLLLILLYEFLFGLGLDKCAYEWRTPIESFSGELSRMKNLVLSSAKNSSTNGQNSDEGSSQKIIHLPRYVRINTLKISVDDALEQLHADGWVLMEVEPNITRKKFRILVDELKEPNFFFDVHCSDVLVFPFGTDLHNESLVESGCLILQDKSSCLPPLCLECKPGTTVMDMCAAPGVKTSHIAGCLQNEGMIFAYDKSFERYRVMQDILPRNGVTCAEFECKDFLRLSLNDKKFKNVTHVLLDPPCSGSGIVKRMDYLTDSNEPVDEFRLKRLSNLQSMMLKHAFTLPNVKRLVYSTCSIYEEENEGVIAEVLHSVGDRFQLVKAMPSWKHRGRRGTYDFGKMCIRASPEKDRTNGFFVAVFERVS